MKYLKCISCKITKAEHDFRRKTRGAQTHDSKCKACINELEKFRRFKRYNRNTELPEPDAALAESWELEVTSLRFFQIYRYLGEDFSAANLAFEVLDFLKALKPNAAYMLTFYASNEFANKNKELFRQDNKTLKAEFVGGTLYDLDKLVNDFDSILFQTDSLDSDVTFVRTIGFYIHLHPKVMLSIRGGSYVKLPIEIQKLNAVINVRNSDSKCFLWSLLAHYYANVEYNKFRKSFGDIIYLKRTDRAFYVSNVAIYKKYVNLIKIRKYPVTLEDLPKIEACNAFSIRVYSLTQNDGYLQLSLIYKPTTKSEVINLLLFKDHFSYISNIDKLITGLSRGKRIGCQICGDSFFSSNEALQNHVRICETSKQGYSLPTESFTAFEDYHKLIDVPFKIYADFESFFSTPPPDKNTKNFSFLAEHRMLAWGFKVVSQYAEFPLEMKTKLETENIEESFILHLKGYLKTIESYVFKNTPLKMSVSDTLDFETAVQCMFCSRSLGVDRVRDHDHISGKTFLKLGVYRGAAHNLCNLKFSKPVTFVPIFFHNLGGYDIHLIIETLGKHAKEFKLIPKSKEKYLSLAVKFEGLRLELRFVDSMHFMPGSLASWGLKLEEEDFLFIPPSKRDLRKKQYFPYNHFWDTKDIYKVLREPTLPALGPSWDDSITSAAIEHANSVFQRYECADLNAYTRLYLEVDVLLLAEIFEKFIRTCKMRFHTTPGYAWAVAFYMTKQKLELLNSNSFIDFFLDGAIKGGISTVCRKKTLIANNPYLPFYDPSKPNNFIIYLDVTNLYGYAMVQALPTGNFREVPATDPLFENPFACFGEESKGYIFELDLAYPPELHNLHIDLPFAAEHMNGKLIPNLNDKTKYKIHYKHLELCLKHGLKITKIHRILEFDQAPWLAEFINMNTRIRKETTNPSEKDHAKLMNNSIFGKSMERILGRHNYKLFGENDVGRLLKYIAGSKHVGEFVISKSLVLLELEKNKISFDKPIYTGFSILELSKCWFYHLIYDVIKKHFANATISYVDTDSCVFETSSDPYKVMYEQAEFFDLSTYPPDFKYFSEVNKGKLGTFKDEFSTYSLNGVPTLNVISEFTALRSKCYSVKTLAKEVKKCKGAKLDDSHTHQDFKRINETNGSEDMTQKTFRSQKHRIYTVSTVLKGILSNEDSKREKDLLNNNLTTPLGYKHI